MFEGEDFAGRENREERNRGMGSKGRWKDKMVLVLVCNCFTFHVSVCSLSLLSNDELKAWICKAGSNKCSLTLLSVWSKDLYCKRHQKESKRGREWISFSGYSAYNTHGQVSRWRCVCVLLCCVAYLIGFKVVRKGPARGLCCCSKREADGENDRRNGMQSLLPEGNRRQ